MNLLKALVTVSGMTLLSRILGFVRDFVIARVFGAGMMTDAFFVAFKLPNLLRRLFAEGAFSQAFVPILGEYKNKQGPEAAKSLVDRVATLLFFVLLAVTLLGMAGAPLLIYLSAPGFAADADKFALTVELTRITFPYILFMSLVALAGGILNSWNRFAVPAFTPVLLNVAFIGMALFAAPHFAEPVKALGWAVFLGGVLQLAYQVPSLRRIGMLPRLGFTPGRLRSAWRHPGVRRILLTASGGPFLDWSADATSETVVHPNEIAEMAVMTVEFGSGPTSRVLRLRANDGGWVPIHVTAHRLQVTDDTFAGLLSLRLPTYGELVAAGDRLNDDLPQS